MTSAALKQLAEQLAGLSDMELGQVYCLLSELDQNRFHRIIVKARTGAPNNNPYQRRSMDRWND